MNEILQKILTALEEIQPHAQTTQAFDYATAILWAITKVEVEYPHDLILPVLQEIYENVGDRWGRMTVEQFATMHQILSDSMAVRDKGVPL